MGTPPFLSPPWPVGYFFFRFWAHKPPRDLLRRVVDFFFLRFSINKSQRSFSCSTLLVSGVEFMGKMFCPVSVRAVNSCEVSRFHSVKRIFLPDNYCLIFNLVNMVFS